MRVGPSLLLVSGVSVSIDRLWSWTDYRHTNTGREETPGSAKRHGRTALQGPAAWESPVWQDWKQIKCRGATIRRSFAISLFLAICAASIKREKNKTVSPLCVGWKVSKLDWDLRSNDSISQGFKVVVPTTRPLCKAKSNVASQNYWSGSALIFTTSLNVCFFHQIWKFCKLKMCLMDTSQRRRKTLIISARISDSCGNSGDMEKQT